METKLHLCREQSKRKVVIIQFFSLYCETVNLKNAIKRAKSAHRHGDTGQSQNREGGFGESCPIQYRATLCSCESWNLQGATSKMRRYGQHGHSYVSNIFTAEVGPKDFSYQCPDCDLWMFDGGPYSIQHCCSLQVPQALPEVRGSNLEGRRDNSEEIYEVMELSLQRCWLINERPVKDCAHLMVTMKWLPFTSLQKSKTCWLV